MCLAQGPQRSDAGEARTLSIIIKAFGLLKVSLFLVMQLKSYKLNCNCALHGVGVVLKISLF